jgi:hypothetical protein
VTVEEGRITATLRRLGRPVWAASACYAGTDDLASALAALAAERPARARAARVTLDPAVARIKEVPTLPRLSRRDLAAHVQLHSRRYFLQNGVPLVTDALPLEGGGARLAAAPLPLVTAVCDGLAAAGLACTDIVPADEPGLSLLPAPQRTARAHDQRRVLVRWAMAALFASLLAGAAWVGSKVRAERAAQEALARMRAPLAAALAVRRDLDAATEALGVLHAAAAPSSSAAFLATLATALPDSAFLVTVELAAGGTVRLAGYAPRAAAVAAALERARLLRAPAFEGRVTRETVLGRERERFTLRAVLATSPAELSP